MTFLSIKARCTRYGTKIHYCLGITAKLVLLPHSIADGTSGSPFFCMADSPKIQNNIPILVSLQLLFYGRFSREISGLLFLEILVLHFKFLKYLRLSSLNFVVIKLSGLSELSGLNELRICSRSKLKVLIRPTHRYDLNF